MLLVEPTAGYGLNDTQRFKENRVNGYLIRKTASTGISLMIYDDSIPLDIQTETKRNSFTLKNEQTNTEKGNCRIKRNQRLPDLL